MGKVRDRKRKIVQQFRGGSEKRLSEAGVDVIYGSGSFVDDRTIKVAMNNGSERILTGSEIFISTGCRPSRPAIPGLDSIASETVLDSTSVMELGVVPGHLVVLGGGPIGVEFGQLFRRLGADVTIIQRGPQLVPQEDPEIASCLQDILREEGISILLDSTASSISSTSSGFDLSLKGSSGNVVDIHGTHLLIATGRVPNTETLNLPAAGVKTDARGYVIANEYLETGVKGIYVLGDVKGGPAFTHISYDDFRIIRHNLISLSSSQSPTTKRLSTVDRQVPYVVYTDPQLAHIGLHSHSASSQFPNRKFKVASMPMSYVARALETDEVRGMMKGIVDAETGEILGFTCLGIEGGEVMSVVQMAMKGGVGWEGLQNAVWAHPTLAESLNNLWGFLE